LAIVFPISRTSYQSRSHFGSADAAQAVNNCSGAAPRALEFLFADAARSRLPALSEEDACRIRRDLGQDIAKMGHVLEPIVGVPARVPIAPAQGPATNSLVVHEFREFMLGMTRSVTEVWSTFDEDDGITLEPIEVCQLRTHVEWDAVAELVQRSLDPR